MATKPATESKPDYTNDDTGQPKPSPPLSWTPPGYSDRRPMRRAKNLRPRRPR